MIIFLMKILKLSTDGLYSNTINSNISDLNINSDIFTLPQYNSYIFRYSK